MTLEVQSDSRPLARAPVVCGALKGGLSAGDLLQGAHSGLKGDVHSVADGLGVVGHRVTRTLEGENETDRTDRGLRRGRVKHGRQRG